MEIMFKMMSKHGYKFFSLIPFSYRKFAIVVPGGGGLKKIFLQGVKRNFFDFDLGKQFIFDNQNQGNQIMSNICII